MEASLVKNGFACYHKVFSQTIRKEEVQDSVVPDSLPDISEIITACGSLLIRSKEISEGRIRLEANVPVKVSFYPEDDSGVCCIQLNIPVYISVEDPSIHEGCVCNTELILKSLETRVLNPRKVTVKAEAEIKMECLEKDEIGFSVVADSNMKAVHVREEKLELSAITSVVEKTFVLTDEFILPPGKTTVAEILGQYVTLYADELKTVGTKAILKGKVRSVLLYRSAEMVIDTVEYFTEFSQIIDTDCATEDGYASVKLLLSGQYYDIAPSFDGRTVKMELHAVAQLKLCNNYTTSCITDAYSNIYNLEICRTQSALSFIQKEVTLRETIRDTIEFPENITEVLSCWGRPMEAIVEDSTVRVSILLKLLCKTAEGKLLVAERRVSGNIAAELSRGDTLEICNIMISEYYAVPISGGVEVRLPIEIRTFVIKPRMVDCISDISYDNDQPKDISDQPSLVIMKVNSEDDLWKIAQENCSTVEAILEANDLSGIGGNWEKLMLIPRTE